MSEMMNTTNQTPIEVALGIDENGMTTARKLYEFLELRPGDFSRWCKTNITENEFASEGEDFMRFRIDAETPTGGKIQREDFKLSASFAKKLSMMSKSERGEEARKYFVTVEDKMKDMAIQIQNISPELRAVLVVDHRVTQVERETTTLRQDFETFKQEMPILGVEENRITNAVNRKAVECLGGKDSGAYKSKGVRARTYQDIYRELKRQFGVSTYKAIRRSQTEIALKVIEAYRAPFVLASQIDECNAQTVMN